MHQLPFVSTLRATSWCDLAGWELQLPVGARSVRRRLPRYVFLYLDRPALLAARLHQRAPA